MSFWNRNPKEDATSIGNILLEMGVITEDELREAAEVQKKSPGILLGAHLVRMGVLSEYDLEKAIAHQEMRRGHRSQAVQRIAAVAVQRTKEFEERQDNLLLLTSQAIDSLKK